MALVELHIREKIIYESFCTTHSFWLCSYFKLKFQGLQFGLLINYKIHKAIFCAMILFEAECFINTLRPDVACACY